VHRDSDFGTLIAQFPAKAFSQNADCVLYRRVEITSRVVDNFCPQHTLNLRKFIEIKKKYVGNKAVVENEDTL
jgi:hypothetical protein